MTPSPLSVFITDEILTLVAQDAEDLGTPDMPLPEWSMALGGSFGGLARALSTAEQSGARGDLRAAALRLGADLVAMVEQLDHQSGRAAELLGHEVPAVPREPDGDYASPREVEPIRADEEPFEDAVVRHVDFGGASQITGAADTEATYWNGDRWRSHLRNFGVRVADAIRFAQTFARSLGEDEPGTLDEIRTPALAMALRGWVENQATTA